MSNCLDNFSGEDANKTIKAKYIDKNIFKQKNNEPTTISVRKYKKYN